MNLCFASGMSGESENSSGNYGHAGQQPGGQATVGCRCHKLQRQPDHDQPRWPHLDLAQHPSQYRLAIDLLVTQRSQFAAVSNSGTGNRVMVSP